MLTIDIPAGDFAGYVFDLDGTLIDSMPAHYRAWERTLQRHGLKGRLDEDYFYALGGVHSERVAALFGIHYGLTLDAEAVVEEKEDAYREMIHEVRLITPVADFARRMAETKPVAIATGGLPDIAIPALEATGLRSLFEIVITPLDVGEGRGKPAPDMFLEAARRMKVPAAQCLAFEDAEPGLKAARAAGMTVVHVPSRLPR